MSADSLFERSFVLSDDSVAVGSKEQHVSLLDVRLGTLFYQCSGRASCSQPKGHTTADRGMVMVRRQTSSVRALHLRSGEERWNFSVGHLELHYLPCSAGGAGNSHDSSAGKNSFAHMIPASAHCGSNVDAAPLNSDSQRSEEHLQFQFDIAKGEVRTSAWTTHLYSPICKAWELQGTRLREITVFDMRRAVLPAGKYPQSTSDNPSPDIYFGNYCRRGAFLVCLLTFVICSYRH